MFRSSSLIDASRFPIGVRPYAALPRGLKPTLKKACCFGVRLSGWDYTAIFAEDDLEAAPSVCERMLRVSFGGDAKGGFDRHHACNWRFGHGNRSSKKLLRVQDPLINDVGFPSGTGYMLFDVRTELTPADFRDKVVFNTGVVDHQCL